MPEIKINVRSLDQADAIDLSHFLRTDEPGVEIHYYMHVQESLHSQNRLLDLIFTYGPPIGGAVMGGILAALKEKIKNWLLAKKECKHRKIPLYGPDGEVLVVVECNLKNHPEI